MNTTSPRHRATLRPRVWIAAVAAIAVLIGAALVPAFLATEARASGSGYTGEVIDGLAWTDLVLEGTMIQDEPYSADLTGPGDGTGDWDAVDLPPGLVFTAISDSLLRISGTPTQLGVFEFFITYDGETHIEVKFTVTVEASTSPTITTLTAPAAVDHTSIPLSATVVGNPSVGPTPTGTVEFRTSTGIVLGTAPLVGGVAELVGELDAADAGVARDFIAVYSGDADYTASTSSASSVLSYFRHGTGTVFLNDEEADQVTVRLVDASDITNVIDQDVTGSDGTFSLDFGATSTSGAASATYYVQATFPGGAVLYYVASLTPNTTDVASADAVSPLNWTSPMTIKRTVAPVWSDKTLATPRVDASYTDAVSATSPNAVTYSVSAGALPSGLSLNPSTGAVTGTPTCASEPCSYDFTILADNGFGTVSQQFTGTLLPAGVPPTWSDEVLPALQQGSAVNDGVVAVGDPTIVYSVTAGALPAGLVLNPATGAITGTPTTAGEYDFTVTASNDIGSITSRFTGTVEAAPEIDLTLDFAAGTLLEDASSAISGGGLKVGSTYTLEMFSTPVLLYTGVIDASGGFTWQVKLPADTPPGAHRLLLTGIAPDGRTLTAEAWFTLLADGTIGAVAYDGPLSYSGLPNTGIDPVVPIGASLLLVLAGVGTVLAVRRRRLTA